MVKYYTLEERCKTLAEFLINNKATVRETAKKFGISKSTVHKDITEKLPNYNFALYTQAWNILQLNKSERHLRGGEATKKKYENKTSKI
ncbi:MAG: stage III sporulation protein D [Ruminococcaceae bacterium]|nr:stage III sporulation protein D [Oscillospiraceae bacterium]